MDPTKGHGRTIIGVFMMALVGMLCLVLHHDRLTLLKTLSQTEVQHRKASKAADFYPSDPPTLDPQMTQAAKETQGFLFAERKLAAVLGQPIDCPADPVNNLTVLRARVLAAAAEAQILEARLRGDGVAIPPRLPVKMKTSYKQTAPRAERLSQVPIDLKDKDVSPGLTMDPFPRLERGCKPQKAVLLSENAGILKNGTKSCAVVDVLFRHPGQGRCTVIMDQPCTWHNYVYKYDGEYWGAASTWSVPLDQATGRPRFVPDTRNVMYAGNMMRDIGNRDRLIVPFLQHKAEIVKALEKVVGKRAHTPSPREGLTLAQGRNESMLVMATNEGHSTMVINFFCDLHRRNQKTPRHLVFATTERLRDRLRKLGITAFWHEKLGTFEKKAASVYGTIGFGRLTYMKQFATYLTLLLGWDVLFQDADVVWPTDPYPDLIRHRDEYHAQFMDDGARTFRFAPFFANSGFYYLTNRHPGAGHIIEFVDQVTMSMAESQTGNQEVLNAILEFQFKRRGFKLRILPSEKYASGKYISPLPKGAAPTSLPDGFLVAHFCWTHNMEVKRERMHEYKSKHLRDDCFNDVFKCKVESLKDAASFITSSAKMCAAL